MAINTLSQLVVCGQKLKFTVQSAGLFKPQHKTLILGVLLITAMHGQADGLGLAGIIMQHQLTDAVSHRGEEYIALFHTQLPSHNLFVE